MQAGAPGRGGPSSAGRQEMPPERTPGRWTHFSPPQFSLEPIFERCFRPLGAIYMGKEKIYDNNSVF